jgi:tRNA U34 5-methylaminomethyl-2-thiouridine-forming methyltransferase MnmC
MRFIFMINNTQLVATGDGSNTLLDANTGEHYHSLNGAVSESLHVYINAGLLSILNNLQAIRVLEIGFGTGLNCMLTFQSCLGKVPVYSESVDCCPLDPETISALNFQECSGLTGLGSVIDVAHIAEWDTSVKLSEDFVLFKRKCRIEEYLPETEVFDLIYFDAFSPAVQPELWNEEIFGRLYHSLKKGGILVTYSSRGTVKRALRQVGFTLERLPGPLGKRHMLRATKPLPKTNLSDTKSVHNLH